MITFFNGVANEGHMVAPRFVDRVEHEGEVVERMPIVTLNAKLCSDRTLNYLDSCLVAVAKRPSTQYHFKEYPRPSVAKQAQHRCGQNSHRMADWIGRQCVTE